MSAPDLIQQQRLIVKTFRHATQQYTKSMTEASSRLKRETEGAEATLKNARQQADALIEEFRKTFKEAEAKVASSDKDAIPNIRRRPKITAPLDGAVGATPSRKLENQIQVVKKILGRLPQVQRYGFFEWGCSIVAAAFAAYIGLGFIFGVLLGIQTDAGVPGWFWLAVVGLTGGLLYWGYWNYTVNRRKLKESLEALGEAYETAEGWYEQWRRQIHETHQAQLSSIQNAHQ
jgi:hypothetical protein